MSLSCCAGSAPGSMQNWHFLVVTDSAQRAALAAIYRKSTQLQGTGDMLKHMIAAAASEEEVADLTRMFAPARYLIEHLHEVPIHVIPCIEGRACEAPERFAGRSLGWDLACDLSFMLAARSHGMGTVLTTLYLDFEQEAADVLGIPYDQVMQVGLIPVASTLGTTFKPAVRKPLEDVLHWDRW